MAGLCVARDSGRQHALLPRDELTFLEEIESDVIRDSESNKQTGVA